MTSRRFDTQRLKRCVLVGGLFLLALAVRLWQLTYHSLWFDETMSLFWAGQPVARIWDVGLHLVEDKHPPLYCLLLHGWILLFGSGDAAVRSLGSLLGALAVLPVYGLGRLLGDRRTGALAALLVALNPFLVWYSQEVRMFMPATTFGLFGLYGVLRAWQRAVSRTGADGHPQREGVSGRVRPRSSAFDGRRAGWWGLALAGLVGAAYSYLFGVFFLVVAGGWVIVMLGLETLAGKGRQRMPVFLGGVLVLALAAGLVTPLLRAAWQVSGAESTPGRMFDHFGAVLARLLAAYTLHKGPWSDGAVTTAQVGAGVLLLIGIVWPLCRRPEEELAAAGRPLLILYLGLPLLLGGVLLARNRAVFDEPRYFTFVVPALCLLWSRGLAVLLDRAKGLGLLASAALPALMIAGLTHLWLPQNLREDWRTAAGYVQTHAGPNDAVLTHVDYMHFSFEHYFGGSQPVFFPFTDHLTDPAQVEPPLLGLLPFDTVWLVQSHTQEFDPNHLVERWFADRFPLATEQYPAGITIKRYITRYRRPEAPPDVARFDAPFGPDIMLIACAVDDLRTPATDERSHPPSAWVHVRLYWRAAARPPADYTTTVRLVDHLGQVWGDRLHRERETLRLWPTSRWQPGEVIREEVDVNLNPITPPGEYRVVVGLADAAGQPLGSEIICGAVQVVK
ncbi:MAG: glycosyltransferase family 39 protein [Chloroflexi bacterium]|nr:glycosyltransferase family 39 protein [Chloroflexota bacterium]